jgi:hypothetical protein
MAITFGKPLSQGTGDSPSIAVNDQSVAVSVHVEGGSIVYQVGSVDKNSRTLRLADKRPLVAGAYPFIAINNNNLVVCVFERNDKEVYSVAGTLNGNTIEFGPETKYDSGKRPSVGVNDQGSALEVHMSESGGAGVYCRVGPFDHSSRTIKWGGSSKYDTGQVPKVALNGTAAAEVHRSGGSKYDLYYNLGTLGDRSHNLAGGVMYYDVRKGGASDNATPSPSVALTDNQIAIGFQDEGEGDSQLSYFFGRVDGKKIGWPETPTVLPGEFGTAPNVAANNKGIVVLTYTRNRALQYLVGTF